MGDKQADRSAFIEDYIQLCRKYGCIISVPREIDDLWVREHENDDCTPWQIESTDTWNLDITESYLRSLI